MAEAIGSELCVNKYLYIGHEQQPIYQIFNAKADPVPGNRETKRSQKIYQKNYGRIKPLSNRNFSTYITCCNLVLVNIFVPQSAAEILIYSINLLAVLHPYDEKIP